jgi:S1-C subfamily serine protease
MSSAQVPEGSPATQAAARPGTGLNRHSVGMAGVLFQSVTFMAPGAAVACSATAG